MGLMFYSGKYICDLKSLISWMSEVVMTTDKKREDVVVLVLDQSRETRQMIRGLLKSLGIRNIYLGEDGVEGIKTLKQTNIDIVVCGLDMPTLGGRDFVRILRREHMHGNQKVPVLLLTSATKIGVIKDARDSGVNEMVAQPFSSQSFIKHFLAALDDHREFINGKGRYFGPDRRHEEVRVEQDRRSHDEEQAANQ